MGVIMMEKGIKTKGLLFVETLGREGLDKGKLFELLYNAVGKDADIKKMGLPSNSAVAYLESNRAKLQIKAFEPRIADTFNEITKTTEIARKRELLGRLEVMTCQPRDYAVIAMDRYMKLDKAHTVDGFYKEYESFRSDKLKAEEKDKRIQNNSRTAFIKGLLLKEGGAVI